MIVLKMDVTSDEDVNDVHKQVTEQLEKDGFELWALVNNAGIMTAFKVEWGLMDDFKSLFDVNVFGLVRVTRVFLPLIRKSKGLNRYFQRRPMGGGVYSE